MSWYLPFGAWGKKETKEESDAKPEAPGLEADDVAAWNFYWQNSRTFVREFGLMSNRLDRVGYEGVAEEIFLSKLSDIHDMKLQHDIDAAKEETGEKPDFVVTGAENG